MQAHMFAENISLGEQQRKAQRLRRGNENQEAPDLMNLGAPGFIYGTLNKRSLINQTFRVGASSSLARAILSRIFTPKGQFGSHLPHIRQSSAVAERDQ